MPLGVGKAAGLGVEKRRYSVAFRQAQSLPWRAGGRDAAGCGQGRRPWCRKAAVLRRFSTSSKPAMEGGRQGCRWDNARPQALVSKCGGTPPLFDKLKIRHGGRQGCRWVWARPQALVSKGGGTPPLFDKLKTRQGWRVLSSARDRSGNTFW